MDLKLANGYAIESSRYSFDLYKIDSKGQKRFYGFYSTLNGALQGYLSLKIKGSSANSVENLLAYLKSLQKECHRLLDSCKLKDEVEE